MAYQENLEEIAASEDFIEAGVLKKNDVLDDFDELKAI